MLSLIEAIGPILTGSPLAKTANFPKIAAQ
jgi:hypothetical protein